MTDTYKMDTRAIENYYKHLHGNEMGENMKAALAETYKTAWLQGRKYGHWEANDYEPSQNQNVDVGM